jgi:phytoene dehydrogenase-like protein
VSKEEWTTMSSPQVENSIIVIGAGIAGLSAGCYGQMNGYRTQIFEKGSSPGGLCTSWRRKGYVFNGCLALGVAGSRPGTGSHRIWDELGAFRDGMVIDREEYLRIEGANGEQLILYADVDRLEQHMMASFPADAPRIRELCETVRLFSRLDMPPDKPRELYGLSDYAKMGLRMLPFIRAFWKHSKQSVEEFGAHFSTPFLRKAFPLTLHFDTPEPMLSLALILAWMNTANVGFPLGGSLKLARDIERRYLDLGGKIHYRSPVERILLCRRENGTSKVGGVRLGDGTEHRADIVISAADGHATLFEMLQGEYVSDEIRTYYDQLPIFPSTVQVSLGVNRDLSSEPSDIKCLLEEPIDVAGRRLEYLPIRHCCYDASLAPPGRSVVVVQFASPYTYWKRRAEDTERYKTEKQAVAETIIGYLERRLPGISEQIEVADVSTPVTTERYTGNWQGSIMGWLSTTDTADIDKSRTLPGLEGFYMSGQWAEARGGLPSVALSGRQVMQMICARDRKAFVSQPADGQIQVGRGV